MASDGRFWRYHNHDDTERPRTPQSPPLDVDEGDADRGVSLTQEDVILWNDSNRDGGGPEYRRLSAILKTPSSTATSPMSTTPAMSNASTVGSGDKSALTYLESGPAPKLTSTPSDNMSGRKEQEDRLNALALSTSNHTPTIKNLCSLTSVQKQKKPSAFNDTPPDLPAGKIVLSGSRKRQRNEALSVVEPAEHHRTISSMMQDTLKENQNCTENTHPNQSATSFPAHPQDPVVHQKDSLDAEETVDTVIHDLLAKMQPNPSNNVSTIGGGVLTHAGNRMVDKHGVCASQSINCSVSSKAEDPAKSGPPRITSSSSGTTNSVGTDPKPIDEFDDLEFSETDFELMDSLENRCNQAALHQQGKVEFDQNTTNSITNNVKEEQDPFGDFPDIDFDELDQTIAKAAATQKSGCTTVHGQVSVDHQSHVKVHQVPPPDVIVRNIRSNQIHDKSGVSFLSFSRYKVVRVERDTLSFTTSLFVAAWRPEMIKEVNASKAIHRSDALKRQYAKSKISQSPSIDGVVHLRGEWYFTEVFENDIIHVCSLRGEFCTSIEALPLILHTNPPLGSEQDDLVLVVHPDMLLTPTGISETVSCSRRAVIKNRIGSMGLSGM